MTKTCMMIAALALAGCSKKSAGSSDCASAVDKGVQTMMAGSLEHAPEDQKAGLQAAMKETGDKLKDILTKHCVDDKWSADVVDCYNKATSQPEIRACRTKLPADQAEKIGQEVRQVMMSNGMRGMRGGGMHGGPGGPGGGMGMPPGGGGAMGGAPAGSAGVGSGGEPTGSAPAGSGSAAGAPGGGSAGGAPAGSAAPAK
jgi:hypothetical protein